MTVWDDLVSVSLVGTERKPVPPEVDAAATAALGADLPARPPELSVLTAAGVLAAHRRAGWTPPRHAGAPPEPSSADDRPVASATAVQLLELLLSGQVQLPDGAGDLVGEWLDRCAATGRRPPERLLPQLLANATTDAARRAATVAAGGPRLAWLAARNDEWAWATGAAADLTDDAAVAATWTTGERDARTAVLAELRATGPAAARALVEETWSGENAKDRAAIITAFRTGLSADDEPFLEAALDDRAAGVRTIAADLLAHLPTSRLAGRMAERVRPLVTVGGRLRKKVEVTYPPEVDKAARRDGITDAQPAWQKKLGPKAWHLVQLVAATPLQFWRDHLGLAPDEVLRHLENADVVRGLAAAAVRQHDLDWARAILKVLPAPALLGVLPAGEVESLVGPILAAAKDNEVGPVIAVLPAPWSPYLSTAVLRRLVASKAASAGASLAPLLAGRLHPSVAPELERWLADLPVDNLARRQVRGLAHALSIRQTIAQELP